MTNESQADDGVIRVFGDAEVATLQIPAASKRFAAGAQVKTVRNFRLSPVSELPAGAQAPEVAGFMRLRAGDTRAQSLELRVAPTFPAGKYRFRLEAEGIDPQIIELLVPEKTAGKIDPDPVILHGAAGAKVTSRFVLRNLGNTPIETPKSIVARFCEDGGVDAALAEAFATFADNNRKSARPTLDDVAGEIAVRLGNNVTRPVRLQLTSERNQVAPGQSAEIDFEGTLPPEMQPGRCYNGYAFCHNLQVDFAVYTR